MRTLSPRTPKPRAFHHAASFVCKRVSKSQQLFFLCAKGEHAKHAWGALFAVSCCTRPRAATHRQRRRCHRRRPRSCRRRRHDERGCSCCCNRVVREAGLHFKDCVDRQGCHSDHHGARASSAANKQLPRPRSHPPAPAPHALVRSWAISPFCFCCPASRRCGRRSGVEVGATASSPASSSSSRWRRKNGQSGMGAASVARVPPLLSGRIADAPAPLPPLTGGPLPSRSTLRRAAARAPSCWAARWR